MATKKAPPRRNTDVIRCENCGEEYSTTYKRCPFCDERPGGRSYPPVGGRRVAGGSRSGRGGQPNPLQVAGLVISLVLIIAAVVIVFTTLSPLLFGSTPSGSNSGGASVSTSTGNVTLESLTLSRTDEDQVALQAGESFQLTVTTVPEDAQVTVEWTSSNEDIATVDEYGNITNVYKGSDQVPVTITAAAGGQTASCAILCTGDGTGENIDTSGDTTGGGTTTSGNTLAPNTDAVITGVGGGGLNIRSGPGTDYSVQASTSDGATVTVLEKAENGWYHIRYATGGGNFEEGYVLGDYLAPSTTQN